MSYQDLLLRNLSAESDPRTTAIDDVWWDAVRNDRALAEGVWVEVRFEVCPVCDGRGTYVNPSIDAHGLTSEDFEDDDFAEDYLGGRYDIVCRLCQGDNVVPVPVDPEVLNAVLERARDLHQMHNEMLAEMRVGA